MSDTQGAGQTPPHAADDDVDMPASDEKEVRQSELVDEGLEETFPASDPPTPKHIT
jgi:hypothetical protein